MKKILLIGYGYIGSYLYNYLSNQGLQITVCDRSSENIKGLNNTIASPYQALQTEELSKFDAILWFAGHSSVPASIEDPDGALKNNCLDLFAFANKKPDHIRMIYASTASIYSVLQQGKSFIPPLLSETEARLNPVNPYDCSKVAFDALASSFLTNITGLRLGTLCGHSPRLRRELIFNSMNIAAINEGIVRVANPNAYRSLLFLSDLAHYIEKILISTTASPKILNTASLNISIGDIANEIAATHHAKVDLQPDSQTYSFQMDCSIIDSLYTPPRKKSIANQCLEFKQKLRPDLS